MFHELIIFCFQDLNTDVQKTLAIGDGRTYSCVTSGYVTYGPHSNEFNEHNTLYSATFSNVQNVNVVNVQILHKQTNTPTICDTIQRMMFTYFESENGCGEMKRCDKVRKCAWNKICEYSCECPMDQRNCGLKIVAVPEVQHLDWSICGVYV